MEWGCSLLQLGAGAHIPHVPFVLGGRLPLWLKVAILVARFPLMWEIPSLLSLLFSSALPSDLSLTSALLSLLFHRPAHFPHSKLLEQDSFMTFLVSFSGITFSLALMGCLSSFIPFLFLFFFCFLFFSSFPTAGASPSRGRFAAPSKKFFFC